MWPDGSRHLAGRGGEAPMRSWPGGPIAILQAPRGRTILRLDPLLMSLGAGTLRISGRVRPTEKASGRLPKLEWNVLL